MLLLGFFEWLGSSILSPVGMWGTADASTSSPSGTTPGADVHGRDRVVSSERKNAKYIDDIILPNSESQND